MSMPCITRTWTELSNRLVCRWGQVLTSVTSDFMRRLRSLVGPTMARLTIRVTAVSRGLSPRLQIPSPGRAKRLQTTRTPMQFAGVHCIIFVLTLISPHKTQMRRSPTLRRDRLPQLRSRDLPGPAHQLQLQHQLQPRPPLLRQHPPLRRQPPRHQGRLRHQGRARSQGLVRLRRLTRRRIVMRGD